MKTIIKVEDLRIEKIIGAMLFHNGEPFATSNQIAKYFGVDHKNVLQKIRLFHSFDELVSQLKIQPRNRLVRGKEYPYYELDADAFTFTCMSFSGKTAEEFKWIIIKAFKKAAAEALTLRIRAQINLEYEDFHKLRSDGKETHKSYTDSIKALCEYAEKSRGSKYETQCPYFSLIQRLVYKALGIKESKGFKPARDAFSPQLLKKVEKLEKKFADDIFKLIYDEIHYKEIYQHLKGNSVEIIAEMRVHCG